jgi:hypothetical protein
VIEETKRTISVFGGQSTTVATINEAQFEDVDRNAILSQYAPIGDQEERREQKLAEQLELANIHLEMRNLTRIFTFLARYRCGGEEADYNKYWVERLVSDGIIVLQK